MYILYVHYFANSASMHYSIYVLVQGTQLHFVYSMKRHILILVT